MQRKQLNQTELICQCQENVNTNNICCKMIYKQNMIDMSLCLVGQNNLHQIVT
jgi:hypothetical protein